MVLKNAKKRVILKNIAVFTTLQIQLRYTLTQKVRLLNTHFFQKTLDIVLLQKLKTSNHEKY